MTRVVRPAISCPGRRTARSLCASSVNWWASSSSRDRRVLQQRAGDGDALLLATGQACAAFAQLAVVALGQFAQEAVGFCRHCGGVQLLVGGLEPAVADVSRRWRRRSSSSRHQRDLLEQRGGVQLAQVQSVDGSRRRPRRGSAAASTAPCSARAGLADHEATVSPGAMSRVKSNAAGRPHGLIAERRGRTAPARAAGAAAAAAGLAGARALIVRQFADVHARRPRAAARSTPRPAN